MTKRDRQVAIVEGRRTPFVKAGTDLAAMDVFDLGRTAVVEVMARADVDPSDVDQIVFGNVSRPVKYHNLAREIGLAAGVPPDVPAYTVGLACASACQATTAAVDLIERGYADVVVAGGAESLSNVPIQYSPRLARALVAFSQAKTVTAKAQTLATVRIKDLAPVAPGIRETSTGLTMGESAENMAKVNGISRESQDVLALRSHERAAKALRVCKMSEEVVPVFRPDGHVVAEDNHIRTDTSLDKLGALKPVFDRRHGTITAGNSSPLTDGGAALVLVSRKKVKGLGLKPHAWMRSYAYAAVDPNDQLLIAPAYAIPIALDRAGVSLSDIGTIECDRNGIRRSN